MRRLLKPFVILLLLAGSVGAPVPSAAGPFDRFGWTAVYDGPWPAPGATGWAGRAGLQAVALGSRLYVMGGRTPQPTPFDPFGSVLWNDVWESGDRGVSWRRLQTPPSGDAMWAERGYFQAVSKGGAMFVVGGQNFAVGPNPACQFPAAGPPVCPPMQAPFVPRSTFFADVWRSTDGAAWERVAADAPFGGRAGLSAAVFQGWIYVLGGSRGDDIAIGGSGRVLFNDVWRSRDGRSWERMTVAAPWSPRAGAAVVVRGGWLYLLGGEDGFLCTPGPTGLRCPYFNDVWRSRDGAAWELVTAAAGWSPRPGHQCQALRGQIVCFGGFGFPTGAPTVAAHPIDMWASRDGRRWQELPIAPWNAAGPAAGKYDFDSLVVGGRAPALLTFGGDREASFAAPDAALVDDEVWRFGPAPRR
jgi:hypothetical protein